MNFKFHFALLFLVALLSSKFCETDGNLAPIAVQRFVENYFIKNSVNFEVIYNSKALSLVDKSLKLISGLKPVCVTQVEAMGKNFYKLTHSALLIFDTFENYLKFEDRIVLSNESGPRPAELFIVCANLSTDEVERNLPADKYQVRRYLIEDNGDIFLKATTLFTPRACNTQQLVEINNFSRSRLQWTGTKFSTARIDNFHGCKLNILYESQRFLASDNKWFFDQNGKVQDISYEGFLFILISDFGRWLNFKQKLYFYNKDHRGYLEVDENANNIEEAFKTSEELPAGIDWEAILVPIEAYFYVKMLSSPIRSYFYCIAVPPGAFYTPEEKFLLPFDGATWTLLIVVFAAAFLVVAAMKLVDSTSLNSFISGENVSSPGLNIFAIFMGIGQIQLPSRNVARILVMNFVLFSLIMRTAYQGKYYEFLTTDPQKNPIRTLDELIASKFPLYAEIADDGKKFFYPAPDLVEKFNVIYVTNIEMQASLFEKIQNSSFAGSLINTNQVFNARNLMHPRENEWLNFTFPKTTIKSYNEAIAFNSNNFLYPTFNGLITRYIENGIFNWWQCLFISKSDLKEQSASEKIILTIDHLSIGFQIWLISLLLPLSAFIGEIVYSRVQKMCFSRRVAVI